MESAYLISSRYRNNDEPAQVDHPHLHRPWHALHPCQTAARMRLLLAGHDPSHSLGPSPAHAGSACGADAAGACEHASGATAGVPAVEESQEGGGTDPADSGTDQMADSGGSAVRGEDSKGGGSSSLRYMLAWYSLVAPALGLPVPLALWTGQGAE